MTGEADELFHRWFGKPLNSVMRKRLVRYSPIGMASRKSKGLRRNTPPRWAYAIAKRPEDVRRILDQA